jgi:UDP-N-acetylglucosamine--N-acetylmuramyl-(pentapeptide) pyrophosphoryl-undecaprenol N-acetylglucosamine transferase
MVRSDNHLIFCGGGSGGHVVPAITVIKALLKKYPDLKIDYIGSINGIEAELIPREKINYKGISSGKLRRYLSIENVTDVFKILIGVVQSFLFLSKTSDKSIVISFGGFVSVPPVLAAWVLGKKILIHEQTTQMGLANKICSKFASTIMLSFEDSLKYISKDKTVFTGYPVREECLRKETYNISGSASFKNQKSKKMFITGGGNGSRLINQIIYDNLDVLTKDYEIIHQVGKAFYESYKPYERDNYKVYDFIGAEIIDLFKQSDIIVSRAGAGTVSELLALGKRSLFIPLKIAQKNEQFHNSIVAKEKLGSIVIVEDDLNNETFLNGIHDLQGELKICHDNAVDGTSNIIRELEKVMEI